MRETQRQRFGVLIPSTNTVVEKEYRVMSVPGVSFHCARIPIGSGDLSSDEATLALLDRVQQEMDVALDRALAVEPDALVMGLSVETFWGGLEGLARLETSIKKRTGLNIATGAQACKRALEVFGARHIGVITPYQEVGNRQLVAFFEELGIKVVTLASAYCATATDIARVSEQELVALLKKVDGPKVEAIVQSGTNLEMVAVADAAERFLAKPVIAVNAATWWQALRDAGIEDRLSGATRLFREF